VPVKALHVIPAVAPRYGGPSRALLEMARAIQSQGVQSLVVTTDADGPDRLAVSLGTPTTYKGVSVLFFKRQWSESFKYSHALAAWLDRNVHRFDVVHVHAIFSHACIAAARACRRHGVPYVVRPLGTLDPWSLGQKRLRKRLLWRLGARRAFEGAAAVHYTAAQEQRLAEEFAGAGRGVVIPLGVDDELLEATSTSSSFRDSHPPLSKSPYVLVLGRVHPKKGLEQLLDVFLDLTRGQTLNGWRLVIAGDGAPEYVRRLQRVAEERQGEGRVVFTGWLDGVERASALREATVVALVSHQENFGLSIVEAMACGVPVLVSRHVNLAEEIEGAGAGWVTSLDRAVLLEALRGVLRADNEWAHRGRAGRELVRQRFVWPAVALELTKLYRSIVQHEDR
jgi:glycosyltransferase involved in cell wall biosynthesis